MANKIDKDMAEQDLNKAIELDPNSEINYRNRAFILLYLDKLEGANADIIKALKMNPSDGIAHYCYALVLKKAKQYKDALGEFDTSIKIQGDKYDLYLDRGLCKMDLHDNNGARNDFKFAMSLNPICKALGLYYLARSYAADKDKENMLVYITSAHKAGLFKGGNYYKDMQDDIYFKYYEKDKDFTNLIFKMKFGKY
jgi:Tfp pilus assembly protein PilF